MYKEGESWKKRGKKAFALSGEKGCMLFREKGRDVFWKRMRCFPEKNATFLEEGAMGTERINRACCFIPLGALRRHNCNTGCRR